MTRGKVHNSGLKGVMRARHRQGKTGEFIQIHFFVCVAVRHMSCQMCVIDLCESLKGVFSACVSYRFINTKCFED